ncbi:MAG: hypothetical protein IH897_00460 [Planctomycetes bacterium]|nr:hypothetical protein [Planctomycetota bacterium]
MRQRVFLNAWRGVLVLILCRQAPALGELPPVPVPPENPITEEKRVLGKILFWDEQLSSNDLVACGTCHIPASGGADPRLGQHPGPDGIFGTQDDVLGSPGVPRADANNQPVEDPLFGFGSQVTGRSAQSFLMSAYAADLFWDGRASTVFVDPLDESSVIIAAGGGLESQAVGPILSAVEMAHEERDWEDVAVKLAAVTPLAYASNLPADVAAALVSTITYPELFEAAFSTTEINPVRIGMAIATYERTLIPDQTPWDLFMAGDNDAMTPQQIQGWNMFQNNTVCDNCHVPPQFTDHLFHNIGLRPASDDVGQMGTTGIPDDVGRFKTPSLRNVGLKASMMHVGWVTDVQDAIHFYNAPAFPEVDEETGHTQYTEDQSGIPTAGGGTVSYSNINMPEETEGGVPMQALIIDFIVNGLADPRVAAETFPFDRPTLRSERPADLDGDGDVDAADLAQLLGAWGPYELCPPFLPGDLDQDCSVGAFDLAVLLGNWG